MNSSPDTISGTSMLAKVTLSVWTARKFDKKATNEVAANHSTSNDIGRYNKLLLPGDAKEYKAVTSFAGEIRKEHYKQTLPWANDGARLLPTKNYMAYADVMRGYRSKWDSLVSIFVGVYPDMQEAARMKLNGLYNESDYPTVLELSSKFDFALEFDQVPANDWRLDLPQDVLDQMEQATIAREQTRAAAAMRDAWERLHEAVSHIHERLVDPDAIFRDSLIENASELCDILPRLNVAGDLHLDMMAAEVKSKLTCYGAQRLREDAVSRSEVASQADAIMRQMAAFYGGTQA